MLDINNAESRPLLTNEQLASLGGGRVAYVKPIRSEDLEPAVSGGPCGRAWSATFRLARCRWHADCRDRLARCRGCQCEAART